MNVEIYRCVIITCLATKKYKRKMFSNADPLDTIYIYNFQLGLL